MAIVIPSFVWLLLCVVLLSVSIVRKRRELKEVGSDPFGFSNRVIGWLFWLTGRCIFWVMSDCGYDVNWLCFTTKVNNHNDLINLIIFSCFATLIPSETFKELKDIKSETSKKVRYVIGYVGMLIMIYFFLDDLFLSRYGTHLIPTLLKRISLM